MQLARKFLDVAGKFNFVEFILSLKNKSDELLRVWHNLFWEFLLFLFCWYSSSVLFCLVVLCRRPNGPLQLALLFVRFYIIQLFLSFPPPYSLAILMLSVEYHKTILKYTGYEAFFFVVLFGGKLSHLLYLSQCHWHVLPHSLQDHFKKWFRSTIMFMTLLCSLTWLKIKM